MAINPKGTVPEGIALPDSAAAATAAAGNGASGASKEIRASENNLSGLLLGVVEDKPRMGLKARLSSQNEENAQWDNLVKQACKATNPTVVVPRVQKRCWFFRLCRNGLKLTLLPE